MRCALSAPTPTTLAKKCRNRYSAFPGLSSYARAMAASSRSGTSVVGMRANAWRCALRPIFVVSREGAEADKSAFAGRSAD